MCLLLFPKVNLMIAKKSVRDFLFAYMCLFLVCVITDQPSNGPTTLSQSIRYCRRHQQWQQQQHLPHRLFHRQRHSINSSNWPLWTGIRWVDIGRIVCTHDMFIQSIYCYFSQIHLSFSFLSVSYAHAHSVSDAVKSNAMLTSSNAAHIYY